MSVEYKTTLQQREKSRKSRLKRWCDPIKREADRVYQQKYRKQNKEQIAIIQAKRQKLLAIEIRLQRKGLDPDKFANTVRAHCGLCDLCGREPNGKWKSLTIDHCHKTGKFRGMLCDSCNRGLGFFLESAELLKKAVYYLEGDCQ
jgi:hypothetical protein